MAKISKKNKKSRIKHVGLIKKYYPRTKRDLVDFDYIEKLSEAEKQWLSSFMEEYAKAHLNHPENKIHKKKYAKSIFAANNARNRDVWGKFNKVDTYTQSIFDVLEYQQLKNSEMHNFEEIFIDYLDSKKNKDGN